jgi:protease-4
LERRTRDAGVAALHFVARDQGKLNPSRESQGDLVILSNEQAAMRLFLWLGDLVYDAFTFARNLLISALGPRQVYVHLDLSGPYPEHRTRTPWWLRHPPTVDDIRRQLRIIGANRRVAGVIVTGYALQAGLASIQSLRAALEGYRARGGRVIVYLPQASTRLYYLATAADTIVMPESGMLDLVGMALEVTFFGDALRRLGIVGQFEQIAEYKTAAEPFTRSTMSAPMRDSLNAILDSIFGDMIHEIARARRLAPEVVRTLVNRAPLSAREARQAGLVDALLFEDELPRHLASGGRVPAILPWRLARHRLRRPLRWRVAGRAIAVISVRGAIQVGESRSRPLLPIPLLGGDATGHATVARAVRAVERNPLFGAIILSVDSPGGSAIASDLIWREIDRAGRRKPVVAFLGNVAASGGYYVAAAARRIISQPWTLTGSIGVIGGKFNVQGLAERLGVHHEILARGEAAAIASPFIPLSEEERRRLKTQMTEMYDRFVDRVAAGRDLSRDDVLAVARGRVWTGRQAQEHRLVDALGDFQVAVDAAKELMGVSPSWAVPVVQIKPPPSVPLGVRGPFAGIAAAEDVWACLATLLAEPVLALMPWGLRPR